MNIILINQSRHRLHKQTFLEKIKRKITPQSQQKTTSNIEHFTNHLRRKGFEAEEFLWDAKPSLEELRKEAKHLRKTLKKDKSVLLIAKGNGGLLAQFALIGTNHTLIQAGTPNIWPRTEHRIINLYANTDATQTRELLNYAKTTGHIGSRKLYGENVRNITMEDCDHDEFFSEQHFALYEELITKIIQ